MESLEVIQKPLCTSILRNLTGVVHQASYITAMVVSLIFFCTIQVGHGPIWRAYFSSAGVETTN